jgi:hypothetical protein
MGHVYSSLQEQPFEMTFTIRPPQKINPSPLILYHLPFIAHWASLEALPFTLGSRRSFVVLVLVGMASSSPSLTPPALTPDYTGSASTDSQSHAEAAVKHLKARRSTAFYPNMNSANKPVKPFSRSAAKRQSVMTLGSIEHLQHYFTKTGIVAKPKYVFLSLIDFLLILC